MGPCGEIPKYVPLPVPAGTSLPTLPAQLAKLVGPEFKPKLTKTVLIKLCPGQQLVSRAVSRGAGGARPRGL